MRISKATNRNTIANQLCIVCGKLDSKKFYNGLTKCNNCGFVWADINLSSEDLMKIYGRDYFFGDEYIDYLAEETILKFGFRKFLNQLRKLFPANTDVPKLLEIGSAYGYFLDIAKEDFYVTGIEISSDAVEYSRNKGHEIFQGDLSKLNLQDKYDIVVSFATLEHIVSPDKIIRQAFHLLKPNGYCYITTIDIGSFFARFRGNKWRMIHPPTHVSYFSSATLKLLMEHNGFEVIECKPIWQYRSLNALFLPKLENSLFYKFVNFLGVTKIPIPFYFGDIIGLLAKKA